MNNLKINPIILVLIMTIAFAAAMSFFTPNPGLIPRPRYIPDHYQIQREPQFNDIGMQVIEQVNSQNRMIQSLQSSMQVSARRGGKGGDLEGTISFERSRNFRMIQSSFFGKEMDIGSNDSHFWFWSKRMKPSKLYYARHENIMRSGLRMPFNPVWMMEILGMKDIIIRNGFVTRYDKYWVVAEERMSTEQKLVNKVTLIDPDRMVVVGHYIYDLNGEILVSAEIKDFHRYQNVLIPKNLSITWFEENVVMHWEIKQPQINTSIDPRLWVMPRNYDTHELGVTSYHSFWRSPDDAFARSLVDPW